ncbi:MAG: flagellar protein FlaG [Lachnospiraceae bacterium]|nr:flagellar protein FlaG [Lachnospiraceae bacterium]
MDSNTIAVAKSHEGNGKQKQGQEGQEAQQQISNESIKKAVENLNKTLNNSEAIFGIHEKTNRVTIKIVDKQTKEVIKELPPEKTLNMIAKVWEIAGLLVDERR